MVIHVGVGVAAKPVPDSVFYPGVSQYAFDRLSVRDKDMPWQERAAPTLQDYSHQFRFFARLSAGKHAQNPKWCSRLEDKALVVARSYYPLKRTCSERPTYSTSTASLLVKYRPCPRERIGRFAQRHCSSRQARWHSTPSREADAKRTTATMQADTRILIKHCPFCWER